MSRLHSLAINSEGFAFNPLSGECFRLNPTAEKLIQEMRLGRSPQDIASDLAKRHGIPPGRALTDVLEFQVQLRQCGLVD